MSSWFTYYFGGGPLPTEESKANEADGSDLVVGPGPPTPPSGPPMVLSEPPTSDVVPRPGPSSLLMQKSGRQDTSDLQEIPLSSSDSSPEYSPTSALGGALETLPKEQQLKIKEVVERAAASRREARVVVDRRRLHKLGRFKRSSMSVENPEELVHNISDDEDETRPLCDSFEASGGVLIQMDSLPETVEVVHSVTPSPAKKALSMSATPGVSPSKFASGVKLLTEQLSNWFSQLDDDAEILGYEALQRSLTEENKLRAAIDSFVEDFAESTIAAAFSQYYMLLMRPDVFDKFCEELAEHIMHLVYSQLSLDQLDELDFEQIDEYCAILVGHIVQSTAVTLLSRRSSSELSDEVEHSLKQIRQMHITKSFECAAVLEEMIETNQFLLETSPEEETTSFLEIEDYQCSGPRSNASSFEEFAYTIMEEEDKVSESSEHTSDSSFSRANSVIDLYDMMDVHRSHVNDIHSQEQCSYCNVQSTSAYARILQKMEDDMVSKGPHVDHTKVTGTYLPSPERPRKMVFEKENEQLGEMCSPEEIFEFLSSDFVVPRMANSKYLYELRESSHHIVLPQKPARPPPPVWKPFRQKEHFREEEHTNQPRKTVLRQITEASFESFSSDAGLQTNRDSEISEIEEVEEDIHPPLRVSIVEEQQSASMTSLAEDYVFPSTSVEENLIRNFIQTILRKALEDLENHGAATIGREAKSSRPEVSATSDVDTGTRLDSTKPPAAEASAVEFTDYFPSRQHHAESVELEQNLPKMLPKNDSLSSSSATSYADEDKSFNHELFDMLDDITASVPPQRPPSPGVSDALITYDFPSAVLYSECITQEIQSSTLLPEFEDTRSASSTTSGADEVPSFDQESFDISDQISTSVLPQTSKPPGVADTLVADNFPSAVLHSECITQEIRSSTLLSEFEDTRSASSATSGADEVTSFDQESFDISDQISTSVPSQRAESRGVSDEFITDNFPSAVLHSECIAQEIQSSTLLPEFEDIRSASSATSGADEVASFDQESFDTSDQISTIVLTQRAESPGVPDALITDNFPSAVLHSECLAQEIQSSTLLPEFEDIRSASSATSGADEVASFDQESFDVSDQISTSVLSQRAEPRGVSDEFITDNFPRAVLHSECITLEIRSSTLLFSNLPWPVKHNNQPQLSLPFALIGQDRNCQAQ